MTLQAKLDGSAQLQKLLKDFPERIQRDVINSTVSAGAQVVVRHAKKNLRQGGHVESGGLLRSIRKKKVKGKHGKYHIYTARPDGSMAHLVEFGTGPRKLSKPTPFEIEPGVWITLTHTGSMPASPFFRPALDENQMEVLKKMMERMAKRMATEAKKMSQSYGTLSRTYKRKLAK